MENLTYVTNEQGTEFAVIDRGNGEFTSMLKSIYDEQQALKKNEPAAITK